MTRLPRSHRLLGNSDSIQFQPDRAVAVQAVEMSWQRTAHPRLIFQLVIWLLAYAVMGACIACAQDADGSNSGKDTSTSPESKVQPQEASTEKTDQAAKVNQYIVKAEEFKISFELEAVVDSPSYQVVNLKTKSFSKLKVRETAAHGQRVARGQVVLQLDADEWERAKHAAEQAVTSARIELEQARKQAESLAEALRLELESSEFAERVALLELDYFVRQGKQQQTENWNEMLKNSEQYVVYAREEYEQLKKMYEADEITEETEEIVLLRAKNELERAEFNLKSTRQRVERQLNFDLARQETVLKNTAASAKLELEQKRQGKQLRLDSSRLQVARAETSLENASRELTHLQDDQKVLAQVADFPGILLFGLATRGQWKGSGNVEDSLVPGESLSTGRPLMTVIGTDRLFVQAKVPEKYLNSLKPGSRAYLVLTASSGQRIELECNSVNMLPVEPNQYRADFSFIRPADSADSMPLMTGKIHVTSYEKANSLTVPIEAVQYELATPFVKVINQETGEQRRQDVALGLRDEKRVEVVQGLREGEHVVMP